MLVYGNYECRHAECCMFEFLIPLVHLDVPFIGVCVCMS